MADRTGIEWTDVTWNPIRAHARGYGGKAANIGWHCEHVSEGCRNCYAEGINRRLGNGFEFKPGKRGALDIFLDEKMLLAPLKWKKPRMIFVCSMTDLFADFVTDEMIDRVFAVMALCPQHTFQVLTKRAARMRAWFARIVDEHWLASEALWLADWLGENRRAALYDLESTAWPLPNVWLGVSAEDQKNWDERKEDLRATPAAIRFASFEPLLGPIDMGDISWLHWAITGGESGPKARPMNPDWPRKIRDDCAAAGVPFFFKQWGEWAPERNGEAYGRGIIRVGKKRAGRLLDGVEHNGMPRSKDIHSPDSAP